MKQVWERLRSELVEIIEWSDATPGAPDPGGDTLAWRFSPGDDPGAARAIRNGSQLIVREGQWAVFLDEGRIADAFGPGRHTLSTANLPLLTSLLCLPSGFESPFKAEVVFVCTRLFSDLKWGTRQPLLLRDPELGPVRLRGFGSFSLRVNDPAWLVREVSGASARMDLLALQDPLRSLIVSRLADVLGRCGCPVFDLASRYDSIGRDLRLALLEDTQQFGLEIPSLLIEALTLPPEVEAALVRRSVRLVEGELPASAPSPPPPSSPVLPVAQAVPGPGASLPGAPRPWPPPPSSIPTATSTAAPCHKSADGPQADPLSVSASPARRPAPPPPPPLPASTAASSAQPAAPPEAAARPQPAVNQPAAELPAGAMTSGHDADVDGTVRLASAVQPCVRSTDQGASEAARSQAPSTLPSVRSTGVDRQDASAAGPGSGAPGSAQGAPP